MGILALGKYNFWLRWRGCARPLQTKQILFEFFNIDCLNRSAYMVWIWQSIPAVGALKRHIMGFHGISNFWIRLWRNYGYYHFVQKKSQWVIYNYIKKSHSVLAAGSTMFWVLTTYHIRVCQLWSWDERHFFFWN